MTNVHPPETTVVIRAFNEERWLPEVLAALARQSYRDFEVVLVDSGSTDRTREIAAARGARVIRLRSEDFTFGHSLNIGIQEARGSLIAILSAHAIPADEHWLDRLVARIRQPDVALVYGGQRGHELSKFSEARDFERVFLAEEREVDPEEPFANNANSAIKTALWNAHPFDKGLPGLEDIEWAEYWMKNGHKVLYEPAACIVHVHTETWDQVRRRFHREGMAARWVGLKILRHIPREVWRELRWCGLDLWQAASQGRLRELAREIVRFRYVKAVATVAGVVDSRSMNNPARRAELYFQKDFPAIVIHGPHRARLEKRKVPDLRPGEVLVRVSYVGVCGTDIEILEGSLGYYKTGMASYPIVPGHESSGMVVDVGHRVTGLSEGDRVVVECIQGCGDCADCLNDEPIRCRDRQEVGVIGQDGAFAGFLVTRARYVHKIPPTVTLAQAALAEPLAVVIKALRRLGSSPEGDRPRRSAVVGAGTIGQLVARVLALRGHSVTVFDKERSRLATLNGVVATAQTLENLQPFEWLVEATGDAGVLSTLLQQSATGATLLLMGFPYAEQAFNFESIVGFDRAVIGTVGSNASAFEEAIHTLPLIDTTPFLQASLPLTEFEKALKLVRSRSVLKVMLQPDGAAV